MTELYLHLKVKTAQKSEKIIKKDETHWQVSIKEPAEQNLANQRLLELIRQNCPSFSVQLIKGQKTPSKIFLLKARR